MTTTAQNTVIAPNVALQRLHAQHVTRTEFRNPHEVVQWLGAIQAQDYASAAWSVGVRLPGATQSAIEQAIAERTIIRTWALRGTLHLVSAADIKWLLALLSPKLLTRFAPLYREAGLDESTVTQSYEAIASALEGGKQLTRAELFADLAQVGLSMEGRRGSLLLNRAGYEGLICLGAKCGKQDTYTLLDEWMSDKWLTEKRGREGSVPDGKLPTAKSLTRDEALAEFALRYFTSHGPATVHDFAWWTGLSLADARAGLEAVKSQLVEETIEDRSYWRSPRMLQSHPPEQESSARAYLLPGFDEMILGYTDRSASLDPSHTKRVVGVNGIFAYTMILDGRVVGTWKRIFRKSAVHITMRPFHPLPAETTPTFAAAAEHYAAFLGLPLVLANE